MNDFRTYRNHVDYVLDEREKLEALAEECTELAQAALKLIRAKDYSRNVTPIDEQEALANLYEELNDVVSCLYILGVTLPDYTDNEHYAKWKRWAERLGYHEDDES